MNILVIQNGAIADVMLTTSILKKLSGTGHVHCITNETTGAILPLVKGISVTFLPQLNLIKNYDLAINLHPDEIGGTIMNRVNADKKLGYGFDGEHIVFFDKHSDSYYRTTKLGVSSNSNLFQLIYGMAGLTWNGEGYELRYFPRNRQRKTLTGLCIRDQNLRDYIIKHLKIGETISTLRFRQSILKQIDEINKCKNLVTDDDGCMHIGLSLRKKVEYIAKRSPSHVIEMFGSGNIHVFNTEILET